MDGSVARRGVDGASGQRSIGEGRIDVHPKPRLHHVDVTDRHTANPVAFPLRASEEDGLTGLQSHGSVGSDRVSHADFRDIASEKIEPIPLPAFGGAVLGIVDPVSRDQPCDRIAEIIDSCDWPVAALIQLIKLECHADLPELRSALDQPRLLPRRAQGRQKHADQNGDDADDHQQLDERKRAGRRL